MVRPSVRAELERVAAVVVGAIDQHAADAGLAHLAEGDFNRPVHRHIKAPAGPPRNRPRCWGSISLQPLPIVRRVHHIGDRMRTLSAVAFIFRDRGFKVRLSAL